LPDDVSFPMPSLRLPIAFVTVLRLAAYACCLLTAGCATSPGPQTKVPAHLFADHLFGPSSKPVGERQIFAVSDAMRRYLQTELRHGATDRQTALAAALYSRGQLKLEYESSVTRTAAEAFDARAGNCLSLVIMTAAFAKELGLRVRYRSVYLQENWSLKGNLLLTSGHVNITLGRSLSEVSSTPYGHDLTIDFLPIDETSRLKTQDISESVVVAMFMNNRAIESMVHGHVDDAYAWARAAVVRDPDFLAAQNTLGLIYFRKGALALASTVFEHVLARETEHSTALSNLAELRVRQGRTADAQSLRAQLARIESRAPMHYYRLGLAAMQLEDYRTARDYFAREAIRTDAPAEVHFWLGLAHYRLGDIRRAAADVERAAQTSGNRNDRELYTGKLAWLRDSLK
jgi:tetratricopeptide (TPR) repeat protein